VTDPLVPLPPVALYVHVPFCVAKCPYCDFVVYAGADARGPRARTGPLYAALAGELELRADAVDAAFGQQADNVRPPLRSVYFGGGTPSLMPPDEVARLLATARSRFGVAADAEITLEANPGRDERGDLAAFRRAGINRVSFGAQSFDAGELRRLGRRHSPVDVAEAVAAAREAGIDSLSLDLLYDLPGQTPGVWDKTLGEALATRPDHLSLYALTLDDPEAEGLTGEAGDHLPTPPGARRWRERARAEQDDDRAADMYTRAAALLARDGWRGYEISNWARPGHESRHNLVYWRREPYEAVGPGAHAFDGLTRRWNSARMGPYLAALAPAAGHRPVLPPGGGEVLDEATSRAESVILALRLDSGIPAEWAVRWPLAAVLEWAATSGLVEEFEADGASRLRLTTRGRLLSNELFARLV
jgi:oxygen-independent coproporphyrinogen-3 oxidase